MPVDMKRLRERAGEILNGLTTIQARTKIDGLEHRAATKAGLFIETLLDEREKLLDVVETAKAIANAKDGWVRAERWPAFEAALAKLEADDG